MATFDTPLYIKSPNENQDVIVFGKAPELVADDLNKGISRFGGTWRIPSYLHAYLLSAKILIENGILKNCLDDIRLPIFYIQRHTTELLIKMLLSWIYETAELSTEIGIDDHGIPSKSQKCRFKRSHNLTDLLKDLLDSSNKFGFKEVPTEIRDLVSLITEFEATETWSRYRTSIKEGRTINHVEVEAAVPLADIQRCLDGAISKNVDMPGNEDSYGNELYDRWLNIARETGRAG